MEVLLAKKRLQERLSRADGTGDYSIQTGNRVIVKEDREFASFRTGDEGTVVSVDNEAGRCEVAFDGWPDAQLIAVAMRHLSIVGERGSRKASPRQKAAASSSKTSSSNNGSTVVAGGKRVVSRWKISMGAEEAIPIRRANGPSSPRSPARWNEEGSPYKALSTITEPADTDAAMRRAVRDSASAIEASLRVVREMKIEKADVLGRNSRVIMLSEENFYEWQEAVKALEVAAGHCSKALYSADAKSPRRGQNGRSVEVPVENVGFRPSQNNVPLGAWPLGAPVYRNCGNAANRSTSAPLLDASPFSNASALMSPRSPSGGFFSMPAGAKIDSRIPGLQSLFSPRLIPGGVSSAHHLFAQHGPPGGSPFVPSLPSLSEVTAPHGMHTSASSLYLPSAPPAHAGVAQPHRSLPGRTGTDGNLQQHSAAVAPGDHTSSANNAFHSGVRTRSASLTTPNGRKLGAKSQTRPNSLSHNLIEWLDDEFSFLHRGLLGRGNSRDREEDE